MARMRNFSQSPGLITSFSQSVVSGEFFLGYHGWETLNRNASIIIERCSYITVLLHNGGSGNARTR
jgi:hypothetical protein